MSTDRKVKILIDHRKGRYDWVPVFLFYVEDAERDSFKRQLNELFGLYVPPVPEAEGRP